MALRKFIQNDNNLAIAYYRFSSESQSEASIDQQREAAHRFAEQNGMEIIREYNDFALSGTTTDRPGYQQMLREVSKLKPAYLILWRTDRLNRDATDFLVARRQLLDEGCRLRFVAEPNIDDDKTELMILALSAAEAQNYSYRLAENIARGQNDIAGKALFPGHKVLGYTTEPATEFGKKRKRYVIDPQTAPIVQKIFHDYADGRPMTEICNELNAQGFRTTRGGLFNVNGMRRILQNESYIGIYKYKGHTIPGGMPAIVDEDTFQRAQSRFAQNKREGARRANELNDTDAPRYWLTGKLFCGHCGASMQGVSGTSGTRKTKHYYYYCREQRHKNCKKKPVRKDEIESIVLRMLSLFLNDTEAIASLAVDIAAQLRRESEYNTDKLRMLQDSRKEVQRQLDNLLKAILAGIINETTQTAMQELEDRKKVLTEAIELEERMQALADDEISIRHYFEKYQHADVYDPVVRDYLLKYFVDRIYLYDDKVVMTCFFGDDTREVEWELVEDAVEADSSAEGSTASSSAPPRTTTSAKAGVVCFWWKVLRVVRPCAAWLRRRGRNAHASPPEDSIPLISVKKDTCHARCLFFHFFPRFDSMSIAPPSRELRMSSVSGFSPFKRAIAAFFVFESAAR